MDEAEPEQDDISSLCLVNGCLNEDEGAKADIETKEENDNEIDSRVGEESSWGTWESNSEEGDESKVNNTGRRTQVYQRNRRRPQQESYCQVVARTKMRR